MEDEKLFEKINENSKRAQERNARNYITMLEHMALAKEIEEKRAKVYNTISHVLFAGCGAVLLPGIRFLQIGDTKQAVTCFFASLVLAMIGYVMER